MSASDDTSVLRTASGPEALALDDDLLAGQARLDAFISYARQHDLEFVDWLSGALRQRGKQIWLDRSNIEPGADWRARVAKGIEQANAFVFVISPDSARSEECANELEIAVGGHKRIVPVVFRLVPEKSLSAALTTPNWISFEDTANRAHQLDELVEALESDLEWRDEHTRLAVRTREWAKEKDRSFLLRGSDLRQAQEWLGQAAAHEKTPPTPLQTEYILASQKGAARTQRAWVAALAVGLAVALGLAVFAFVQRQQARNEARVADSRALAAEATAGLSADPEHSLSLALRSAKIDPNNTAEQALRLALAQERVRMVIRAGTGSNTAAAWNPHRAQIAVTAPHGLVALWDSATGRLMQTLPVAHSAKVTQLLYDPSGSRLAALSSAGYVSMWNIAADGRAFALSTGRLNASIQAAGTPSGGLGIGLTGAWAGQQGDEFDVWGTFLSNVFVFSTDSGVTSAVFQHPLEIGTQSGAVSPDGSRLVAGAVIYSLHPGHQTPLRRANGPNGPACWLPDGSAVVTSTTVEAGGPAQLFRANSGIMFAQLQTPAAPTTAVACSAASTDQWVAAGDAGGNVVLRLADGTVLPLSGHNEGISAIASSLDGRYLATASDDGTARIWDASNGRLISVLAGGGASLTAVQFAPGDGLALTVDSRGMVRIWDTGVGEPVTELQGIPHGQTLALGFTSSGRRIFGAHLVSSTGASAKVTSVSAVFWNARSGRLAGKIALPGIASSTIHCAANFSLAGAEAYYSGSNCGLPPPSNLALAVPVQRLRYSQPFTEILALAVSPDGRYLAYARARSVALLTTGGRRAAALPVAATPTGLSFAVRGNLIVMTDTAIYVWKPLSGQRPVMLPQSSAPLDVALSASSDRLAVATANGTVTVWDTTSGLPIRSFRPANTHTTSYWGPTPLRVALTANGNVVASGNANGTVFLWNVTTGKRIAIRAVSTWPITELDLAAHGSRLLAVDWPQTGTDINAPGNAEVLNPASGQVIAAYNSPVPEVAPVNPGAALDPGGNFLFTGTLGLAPSPPGGTEATYQLSTSQSMTGLAAATRPTTIPYPESPAQPWSPDQAEIIAGNALYPCDACGPLPELQTAAASRIAWAQPLSTNADRPPTTDPYR
jgi:WD40 repeat protein